jgi:hypothetical protein
MKNLLILSGETSTTILERNLDALSIASVSKSVAKFVTLNFYVYRYFLDSLKAMASEYASSPVEQAAIHARSTYPSGKPLIRSWKNST